LDTIVPLRPAPTHQQVITAVTSNMLVTLTALVQGTVPSPRGIYETSWKKAFIQSFVDINKSFKTKIEWAIGQQATGPKE
jgi:hypothetical protein